MRSWLRFALLTGVLVGCAGGIGMTGTASAQDVRPEGRVIKFDAYRNGSHFGVSTVKIVGSKGAETVEVVTALRVGLGPITVFKYLLRTRIQWREGRIERLQSVVNDDGDVFRVDARRTDAGLMVEGGDGKLTVAADILATTYWQADMLTRHELLSIQHGRVLKVGFETLGEETIVSEGKQSIATHFAMRGDLDLDIWYDTQGEWVKLTFKVDNSDIEYRRVTVGPSDLASFVPLDQVPGVSGSDVQALIDP